MSKRVIDLSSGSNAIPQRQQQRFENHPPPVQRQVQVRKALLQDIQTPTYTIKDVGPFENVRHIQEISAHNQVARSQMIQHHPVHQQASQPPHHHHPVQETLQPLPQVVVPQPQSHQDHPKKDPSQMVNGCDISGCTSMNDVYEKNKGKIKLLLM